MSCVQVTLKLGLMATEAPRIKCQISQKTTQNWAGGTESPPVSPSPASPALASFTVTCEAVFSSPMAALPQRLLMTLFHRSQNAPVSPRPSGLSSSKSRGSCHCHLPGLCPQIPKPRAPCISCR